MNSSVCSFVSLDCFEMRMERGLANDAVCADGSGKRLEVGVWRVAGVLKN